MRNAVRHLFIVVLSLSLGAHFLRGANAGLALTCAAFPLLLVFRRRWCAYILSAFLLAGAARWFWITDLLAAQRAAMGHPWGRMALILGGVGTACVLGAVLLHTARARARFNRGLETAWAGTAAFGLVFVTCGLLQARLHNPIPLLAERFWPEYGWYWLHVYAPPLLRPSPEALQPGYGWGWLQVFALSVYAAFVAEWLVAARSTAKLRGRLWLTFSIVFFAQLIVGLLGVDKLLMTGHLHLPVPALILAGPLYRGEGLFMLFLFLSTVLIVGPAWCSWLCYVGAWDGFAASGRRPRNARHFPAVRAGILVLVLATAFTLRRLDVGAVEANVLAAAFGLVGVGVMAAVSRRLGYMVHCTSYCPIGLASNTIGRINPFRVRIGDECDECRACTGSCRYAALNIEHIRRRRPGITCTLCGDCLAACKKQQIGYRFPEFTAAQARTVFLVLVAVLHAVFLGVARI